MEKFCWEEWNSPCRIQGTVPAPTQGTVPVAGNIPCGEMGTVTVQREGKCPNGEVGTVPGVPLVPVRPCSSAAWFSVGRTQTEPQGPCAAPALSPVHAAWRRTWPDPRVSPDQTGLPGSTWLPTIP